MAEDSGEVCQRCGGQEWRPRPVAAWLWEWFTHGGALERPRPRVCGRCGARPMGGPDVRYLRLRHHRTGPLGTIAKPFAVLRSLGHCLKRQRGIVPSPIVYAVPAVVGAAAGLLLRRRRPRWAWVSVAAMPSAVWCIAAATAFTHGKARQTLRELRLQASLALHPEQGAALMQRATESRIRSSSLPLYGLPATWEGRRSLGGWGEGATGINHVTLAHGGSEDGRGPFLRVGVSSNPYGGPDEDVRWRLVAQLRSSARRAAPSPPPPPMPRAGKDVSIWAVTVGSPGSSPADREERPQPPDDAWRTMSIQVDDDTVAFTYLEEAGAWIAWARVGDLELEVLSRGFPVEDVALVRVRDLQSYLRSTGP